MTTPEPHCNVDLCAAKARETRLTTLRELVERAVYDIPSDDVAASIMRGVLVPDPAPPALR